MVEWVDVEGLRKAAAEALTGDPRIAGESILHNIAHGPSEISIEELRRTEVDDDE